MATAKKKAPAQDDLLMGPVLGLRAATADAPAVWRVTVLIVIRADAVPPKLTVNGKADPTAPRALRKTNDVQVLRYAIPVKQLAKDQVVAYSFGGTATWRFPVPAVDQAPRFNYVSCNGFSSANAIKDLQHDAQNVWSDLITNHDGALLKAHERDWDEHQAWVNSVLFDKGTPLRFHAMLMGGDQIYMDSIWDDIEALKNWSNLPVADQSGFAVDAKLADDIERYYFELYINRWRYARGKAPWPANAYDGTLDVACALATIPTLIMWDDHDIFDGWGSYSPELQASPVFRALFAAARRNFWVYQLQMPDELLPPLALPDHPTRLPRFDPIDWNKVVKKDPYAPPFLPRQPGFSHAGVFGSLAILVPDLRTERSQSQVIGGATWDAMTQWLTTLPDAVEHLLFISSVPVAHPKIRLAEAIFSFGMSRESVTKGLSDDVRDHWSNDDHEGQRKRLVRNLIAFADGPRKRRVTMVSGDVHLAAWGVVEANDATTNNARRLNQLTSSAVVHPAPSGVADFFFLSYMEHKAKAGEVIDSEHRLQMMELPGAGTRLAPRRNWLAIELDEQTKRLWATWRLEQDKGFSSHMLAVHPARSAADDGGG
ncbi:alkaline phosphatase D family protein [Paraburkholderia kirstenboschensis]|uniref:Alkaline phosphatase family protein n=1 Tax=Paraburkholderia kirstenboschensis TaxID=1245436 RepID=A0ABZ0EEC7_9BURK|nr:alkaline phosphatase family protein [Paraburkholderia kirstenboschensis]WOD14513.1 alkaline phosphatase family protein [Paraburkholderia kirstenboschensis]